MTNTLLTATVQDAVSFEGYRSLQQKVSDFGSATGYNGSAWAGSFIQTVFQRNGVTGEPHMTGTTAALSEYIRRNRLYHKPRVGDIAFFGFSTDGTFSQPHVGLVTDVSRFKTDGVFMTVEGQTESGKPMGPQSADGVYQRVRTAPEVVGFARPAYRTEKTDRASTAPFFRVSQLQPGKTSKATISWQLALHEVNGATGMERGKFDRITQAATATFQRASGELTGRGIVTDRTIQNLAKATDEKYFRFRVDTE